MRRLPLVVVLMAACAAAGCTTVSPAPPPSGPPARARPAAAADAADHPGGGTAVPSAPPVSRVTGTARPDAPATPAQVRSAPRVRVRPAAPGPRRGRAGSAARRAGSGYGGGQPATGRSAVSPPMPLPGGAPDVCRLGETYGGWAHGSPAAHICRRASGR